MNAIFDEDSLIDKLSDSLANYRCNEAIRFFNDYASKYLITKNIMENFKRRLLVAFVDKLSLQYKVKAIHENQYKNSILLINSVDDSFINDKMDLINKLRSSDYDLIDKSELRRLITDLKKNMTFRETFGLFKYLNKTCELDLSEMIGIYSYFSMWNLCNAINYNVRLNRPFFLIYNDNDKFDNIEKINIPQKYMLFNSNVSY